MEQSKRDVILKNIEALVEGTRDLNSVLNKLREKNVINDFMVDNIKKIESDRKRKQATYEQILECGPDSFRNLVQVLYEVGHPELAKLLRPNQLLCTENDGCGMSCLRVTPSSRRRDIDYQNVYKMGSRPKGHVLLVDFCEYYSLFKKRKSGKRDLETLRHLWEDLGFSVKTYTNLNETMFYRKLDKFTDINKLNAVDCIVVHIISSIERKFEYHDDDYFYTSDDVKISIGQVVDVFEEKEIKTSKPILLFFQNFGMSSECSVSSDIGRPISLRSWVKAHYFITRYAFLDDPLNNQEEVSWFVKELAEVLSRQSHSTDFLTMMENVSRKLRLLQHKGQVPTFFWSQSRFEKKLYFNPGLYNDQQENSN